MLRLEGKLVEEPEQAVASGGSSGFSFPGAPSPHPRYDGEGTDRSGPALGSAGLSETPAGEVARENTRRSLRFPEQ